jgi:hypothetical protein
MKKRTLMTGIGLVVLTVIAAGIFALPGGASAKPSRALKPGQVLTIMSDQNIPSGFQITGTYDTKACASLSVYLDSSGGIAIKAYVGGLSGQVNQIPAPAEVTGDVLVMSAPTPSIFVTATNVNPPGYSARVDNLYLFCSG